jgi:hypothetical protein
VVVFLAKRTGDGVGQAEILKGGQKVVLSMRQVQPPGLKRRSGRNIKNARVPGASFCWLKGASQKSCVRRLKNTRLASTG